ncbi:hypothetical protein ACIBAI_26525 [Streptomyces sp. NPDC051041]|uniref:hypothetical protein n=1 Tax=Streptomyces sp. NPDC051041 TaxID=3365640 RepID=UPI0037959DD5
MGSVGDSYDNALAEHLWMLIKTEGLSGRTFATRVEVNNDLPSLPARLRRQMHTVELTRDNPLVP